MWISIATIVGLTFAGTDPSNPSPSQRKRLNVLFIAVDDLNHWVGYIGRNPQAKTPNIDRLAARGVAFTHSYCAAPVCNPSRAALLSGRRPGSTGVYDNAVYFAPYIPVEQTLPTAFRKAGYFVCGAGKIYHNQVARPEEWEDYLVTKDKASNPARTAKQTKAAKRKAVGKDTIAKDQVLAGLLDVTPLDVSDERMPDLHTVDYAIRQLQKKHDRPLFLAVGLVKPHLPFSVPKKYYALHPLDKIQLPPYREDDLADIPPAGVRMALLQKDHAAIQQTGTWKLAIQGYLAAISFCDAMVGRLLDALDNSDFRDNTVIVFWGDHGWHLGEKHHWRKFALWEEATRAPMIYVAPGVTKPGGICGRTVDFMSIYPTLCDLCDIPIPKHVEGESIRSLLVDPKSAWTKPAVTTHGFQNHAVRTDGWRYIRYADGGEELYDENADPYEWTNLAGNPDKAELKARLAKLLPTANVTRPITPKANSD